MFNAGFAMSIILFDIWSVLLVWDIPTKYPSTGTTKTLKHHQLNRSQERNTNCTVPRISQMEATGMDPNQRQALEALESFGEDFWSGKIDRCTALWICLVSKKKN